MATLRNLGAARDALGLDLVALQSRTGFYWSYARNLERGRTSDGADTIWGRLANPAQPWLGPAMIASSYRNAAQYAELFDTRLAVELMLHASRAYLDAGAAFGLFLAAGAMSDDALRQAGGPRELRNLTRPDAAVQFTSQAADDPVQQAYLLLAVVARPVLREQFPGEPEVVLRRLSSYGLEPVGAEGIPLDQYLDIARLMLENPVTARDPGAMLPEDLAREMAIRLAAIGRAHAAALHANRRNDHLWRSAAAPVNIVDLEQTALFGLCAGPDSRRSRQVLGQVADLVADDEFAQVTSLTAEQTAEVMPSMTDRAAEILRPPDRERRPGFGDDRPFRDRPPGDYPDDSDGR
jgi:hypothetical protein